MNRKKRRADNRGRDAGGRKTITDGEFVAAAAHHRAGRLGDALQAYERVLPKSAAFADAMRFGGQVALRLGDTLKAANMLARAADLRPADAGVHYNLGFALKECGRVEASVDPFRRAAELDPADAEAPANMGSALAALDRHPAALSAFEEALKRRPSHPAVLSNMGLTLHALGRHDEAVDVLNRARAIAPDNFDAAINLGLVLRGQRKTDQAIQAFEDALADGNEAPRALANLGAVLLESDRVDDAVATFHRLVSATPGDAAVYHALGGALYNQGDIPAAVEAFRQAIRLRPAYGEAWDNLGIALQAMGELGEAVRAHRRATEYLTGDVACLFNLGTALHAADRTEDARGAYQRCLAQDPAHTGARHMLTALTDGKSETAPQDYVENLFDSYARWFEEHLVHGLGYNMPERMRGLFDRLIVDGTCSRGPIARVLDLGCGTGLVGAAFRDVSSHLVGIDISRRMIAESRRKDIYDELTVGEMVAFLDATRAGEPYGLTLAADVLVYVGDLAPLFGATAGAMQPGAPFLLSVEKLVSGDYTLSSTGRFAHSADYIRRCATAAGFTVVAVEETELRHDRDTSITGLLCALVRDGA